jgi:hypothetical protein
VAGARSAANPPALGVGANPGPHDAEELDAAFSAHSATDFDSAALFALALLNLAIMLVRVHLAIALSSLDLHAGRPLAVTRTGSYAIALDPIQQG